MSDLRLEVLSVILATYNSGTVIPNLEEKLVAGMTEEPLSHYFRRENTLRESIGALVEHGALDVASGGYQINQLAHTIARQSEFSRDSALYEFGVKLHPGHARGRVYDCTGLGFPSKNIVSDSPKQW